MSRLFTCRTAALAVTIAVCHSSAFGSGAFVSMGVLGDGAFSEALGVNSDGQVVGSSRIGSFSIYSHAVLLTAGPGGTPVLTDMGTLGGSSSGASAINSSGAVVGSAQVVGDVAYRAFYAENGGGMRSLGTLGGSNSGAAAINANGQVVGEAETDFFGYRAFRTAPAVGAMVNLGTLGGQYSSAKAINDSGQVVGGSYVAGPFPDTRAFRYTGNPGSGGAMVDLGTLGGPNSFAYGINNAGVVVGEADVSFDPNTGNRVTRAFRYTGTPGQGGVMTNLGTLGGPNSVATSINKYGAIVGQSDLNANGDTAPFVYVNGQMINLDAWFDAVNPSAGLNRTLLDASSITDTGYIVGRSALGTPFGAVRTGYRLDAISLVGLRGDATRDGAVNFSDLLILAQNYSRTSGVTWDTADFNTDGVVNFTDLLSLAQNYNRTLNGSLTTGDFAADWALAQSLIPEPASVALLAATLLLPLRRRRRN
jgi:probable HAF family extracellular repeat protein